MKKYNSLQTLSPKKSCGCKDTLLKHCTVAIYYFPTDEDDEGPTFKEKLLALCLRGIDVFCVWDCCWPWVKIQEYVGLLVFDPFVELFITLCIVVNTLFMALDHYDMNKDMERALKSGNYVSCSDLRSINLTCLFSCDAFRMVTLLLFLLFYNEFVSFYSLVVTLSKWTTYISGKVVKDCK